VYIVGVSKKTEKPKKSNREKNRLEFKKNRLVQFGFGFIRLRLEKPNRTQTGKKPSQAEKTESN